MVHEKVLMAFEGVLETQPIGITAKLGERKLKIYIGMGEIRIPVVEEIDEKAFEKHDCKVKRAGNQYIIIPNLVEEIIERDGCLCSFLDRHRDALRAWFLRHGARVVKEAMYAGDSP